MLLHHWSLLYLIEIVHCGRGGLVSEFHLNHLPWESCWLSVRLCWLLPPSCMLTLKTTHHLCAIHSCCVDVMKSPSIPGSCSNLSSCPLLPLDLKSLMKSLTLVLCFNLRTVGWSEHWQRIGGEERSIVYSTHVNIAPLNNVCFEEAWIKA